ncbi:CapA family protein [Catellatospora sp. KI3]|uniref:CapA family protein n=1 Tax=Catellatospora sp. KI3 TaxID=3041620 RepID=UPI002482470E|nr:CapA family protein [Catellatospora sp. KI3]MDI1461494.1 CapA family protein [Catellatospora sp. KI3]
MVRVVLAGDTMLGRGVGDSLAAGVPFDELFSPAVRRICAGADACVVNLECCVSDRGERWAAPGKPFFFRAPPRAAALLSWLGVGCVTLANNHALDYGSVALLDTLGLLDAAGIAVAGAGPDEGTARAWRVLDAAGLRLGVLGVTDHPADFAATATAPGVAYADLHRQVPEWLLGQIGAMAADTDLALVMPHWGPNMTTRPVPHVRAVAPRLLAAGAALVAGHSAHVFHGVRGPVLYDLGDFIDDYAVDPHLRNDLGLLFEVTVDERGPVHAEAVPLALDYCRTRLARGREVDWIGRRFAAACAELGGTATPAAEGRWRVPLC